jgi:hypothetical protein
MSTHKKTETTMQQPGTAVTDALTKTTKKCDIELSEEELKRSVGGIIVVCDKIKPL